jgi:hypothetical protein
MVENDNKEKMIRVEDEPKSIYAGSKAEQSSLMGSFVENR